MPLDSGERGEFLTRVWLVIGCVLATGVAVVFLWTALDVALMIFGGVLLGILLQGLAEAIQERTPLSYRLSLASLGVLAFGLGGSLTWWLGPHAAEQFGQLAERIPDALEGLRAWVRQLPVGDVLLSLVPASETLSTDAMAMLVRATGVFTATFGVVSTGFVVAFLGIYFAASPERYRRSLLSLAPPSRRDRIEEVLDALGSALRSWLIGRTASMLVVALLTGIGLLIFGIPLVLSLTLLAFVLNFIPFIGPIAAAIPAVLIAWGSGGLALALWVALFYWGVQLVEGFAVTPYIQQHVVSIPPALLVTSQIILGLAAGIFGVLVATPLAVVVVVLVQMLYEEDVLHEEVEVWGA